MGCDIHMHAERRFEGRWIHVGEPDPGRDYELFYLLGGISRRPVKRMRPIAPYRGVPADITPETAKDHQMLADAAHSATWLTLKELEDFARANAKLQSDWFWRELVPSLGDCTLHEDCAASDALSRACVGGSANIRLVFWFDS